MVKNQKQKKVPLKYNNVCVIIKRMKDLFLKRRLIKVLYEKFNLEKIYPTRKEFVEYFIKNKRGKFLYRCDTLKKYSERINLILGDCIAPPPLVPREQRKNYYIDFDPENRSYMSVTERGRELLSIGGFIQIIGEKFSKMWFLFGAIIAFLIGKYWNSIWDSIWDGIVILINYF